MESEVFDKTALAALAPLAAPARSTAYREVFSSDSDRAPVELAEPHHVRGRRDALESAVRIVACSAGELTHFLEGPRVNECGDALANGEASLLAMAPDRTVATERFSVRVTSLDFVGLHFPGQFMLRVALMHP